MSAESVPVTAGELSIAGCTLGEVIGEGGVARVFRGTWEDRSVAVKVFDRPDRADLRRRFLHEGRLLQRLQHPGLVRCLAVIDGPAPALVLELLDGITLERRLADGPLDVAAVGSLARSLLEALGHLHQHGIIHRDIKPANVWLRTGGEVVLMDLGLAADPGDPRTTEAGAVVGTRAYMAPELLSGGVPDIRADLYSLGVTLHEALTGRRPDPRAAAAGPPVPGVPAPLQALVDRLLARDPADRPHSATTAATFLLRGARSAEQPLPLVGRGGAIGALAAVIDSGGVLRVHGEVGSGTGAVVRAARELAAEAQAEFAAARCHPGISADDLATILARELTVIGVPCEGTREGVAEAAAEVVERGGLVIAVEDLDLAGFETSAWLEELGRVPGIALVVGGVRLPPLPHGRELWLRPLDADVHRALLAALLDTELIPNGFDVRLRNQTGGLAGLTVLIVRDLIRRGGLWREQGGAWSWDPATPFISLHNARGMLERALAQHNESVAMPPLRVMALAGMALPAKVILAACGLGERSGVLARLHMDGLTEVQKRDGEEWVTLRRPWMEAPLLQAMDADLRCATHVAIAAAWRAERPADTGVAIIHEGAAAPGSEAAEAAISLCLHIARHGRAPEALSALERLGPGAPDAPALVLARVEAYVALGRLSDAQVALRSLPPLEGELASAALEARADLALAVPADPPKAGRAVGALPPAESSARSAAIRAEHGLRTGRFAEAERILTRGLELAPSPQTDRVAWRLRALAIELRLLRGELDAAVLDSGRLEREMHGGPLWTEQARTLGLSARILARLGQLSDAAQRIRDGLGLAVASGAALVEAWLRLADADVHRALGDESGATRRLTLLASYASSRAPYSLRAELIEVMAAARLAAGDRAALLNTHVRGAEAAAVAGDLVRETWHLGGVACLTADVAGTHRAFDTLRSIGARHHLARLIAAASVLGGDGALVPSAESEIRRCGDRLLLLEILHRIRTPMAREEAQALTRSIVPTLHGRIRHAFVSRPDVRWALDGPAGAHRDTGQ